MGIFLMKYTTILFDIDNTILDFDANELCSLKLLLSNFGYTFNQEFFDIYHKINRGLWDKYEKGIITIEEVVFTRFQKAMNKLGYEIDGVAFEKEYRRLLGEGHQLMPNAIEVLEKLHKTHDLYIVTNGVHETQIKRLIDSNTMKYFKDIFDSETLGVQKPFSGFFTKVKNSIASFEDSKTLLVGDSLNTDILGGNNSNLDTCHIVRSKSQTFSNEIVPTYRIENLTELFDIV